MKKKTQTEKILDVLSDGDWHSNIELFETCNCWRVGARIFDIRAKGYLVEAKNGKGPKYYYRALRWKRLPKQAR